MIVSITFGTDEDLSVLEAFNDRLYPHPFPFRSPESDYHLSSSDYLLLARDVEAKLIGYLAGTVDYEAAHVLGLVTSCCSRGHGVGTTLLHDFAALAEGEGAPVMALQAVPAPPVPTADLVMFYERRGFAKEPHGGPFEMENEGVLMQATPRQVREATHARLQQGSG